MKSPRLIPVVIAASAALLLFKGIGLMTSGGYVLTGAMVAQAEEGASSGHSSSGGEMPVASDAAIADNTPVVEDSSATMSLSASGESGSAGGHGEAAAAVSGDHAATPAEGEQPAATHGADPAAAAIADAVPATGLPLCPPDAQGTASDATSAAPADASTSHEGTAPAAMDCVPQQADAVPMVTNGEGQVVPLDSASASSQPQVLERLGQRRDELDKLQADLTMRESLLKAAEQQLQQQSDILKQEQGQGGAQGADAQAAEQQQMAGLVTMYEAMKPKEAAVIFSQLDMTTLLKVARAMNPRKMGPILAKMDIAKAQALTAALAADPATVATAAMPQDNSQLPQIIGQ